jgi:Domain of unknown function (DUF4382)
MVSRKLACGLAVLAAGCFLSCGSSTTTTTTTATGGLNIFITDSPKCNVLSYRTVIMGMRLISQTGAGSPNVFPGATGAYVNVDFAALRDVTTLLHAGTIAVGTYNQMQIAFGPTEFTLFDPTQTPPTQTITANLTNTTHTFNIQPPLTVVKGQIYCLRVDLDVQHSIGTDAQGNPTGDAPPAVTVNPLTSDPIAGFGRMQDMKGFVLSVTNGSTLTQYIGAVNVQLLSGTASVPVAGVEITPDTLINGQPATSQAVAAILGGSFVEIDGYVNAQGSLVANALQVEDQEDTSKNRVGLVGHITSVTRDPLGQATQFSIFVSEEQPESQYLVPVGSIEQVEVTSSTLFHTSSQAVNFASLPFDATSLQIGQEVIVHGLVTTGSGTGPSVSANSIYPALQAHEGNFASMVQLGSDDKTGAFWFQPCAAIFQGLPILVVTNGDTAYLNLTGLSALVTPPTLIVKGMVFYELQGGTVNGVSVPPGTLVMLADQVHRLQ